MVTLQDVLDARARIAGQVVLTPCTPSETFGEMFGGHAWFKFENLQRTGSFKERGALNRMLLMPDGDRARGVIAASAGNHAQGVAYHASRLGIPATIVMPDVPALVAPLVYAVPIQLIAYHTAVFIGTDASERWSVDQFRAFAEPYFSKGTGWTYVPRDRHIVVAGGEHPQAFELLDGGHARASAVAGAVRSRPPVGLAVRLSGRAGPAASWGAVRRW